MEGKDHVYHHPNRLEEALYHIVVMMKGGSNVWFETPPVVSGKQALQAQETTTRSEKGNRTILFCSKSLFCSINHRLIHCEIILPIKIGNFLETNGQL
jgi:hypothetical protein